MYLSEIEIENYRTFRHIVLRFHEAANYLVGDNYIGKSNFLDLLRTSLSGRGFVEKDFMDPERPIRIVYTLSNADRGRAEKVRVVLTQEVREAVPRLTSAETGEAFPLEYIRRMYYLPFSVLDAERGAADAEERAEVFSACLSDAAAREGLAELLTRYGIEADLTGEPEAVRQRLARMLSGGAEFGRGRQVFQVLLAMGAHVFAELLRKKRSRAVPFEEIVVTDERGRRILPVLLSVDEPELHLHPYMQRAVLAFLTRILNNEEPFFRALLSAVLGIDELDGQLFVVTHSTDALIDDYRSIIRLYWDEEKKVQAACGAAFRFDRELEKHLIMHFPEVKEALYARCALLVEGETEYGAFGRFGQTLGIHFDYYGISLINARGESSIAKIAQLMRRFHVPTVALYDSDVRDGKKASADVFYTDEICFEMDVVRAALAAGRRDVLDAAVRASDDEGRVSGALVKKAAAKLVIPRTKLPPRKLANISARDAAALEFYYFAWLYGNKGVIIGRTLGDLLGEKEIPPAFRRVIEAAAAHAKSPH